MQPKKGVGWGEKDGFIKSLRAQIIEQLLELDTIMQHGLNIIYQEIKSIQLKLILHWIDILDQQTKSNLRKEIISIVRKIRNKFSDLSDLVTKQTKWFRNTVNRALEQLVNQGWGDITWEQVAKFRDQVSAKIEERINAIFDNRFQLVTKAITQAIAFYNDFLERQERYQQEPLEQRETEKTWIEQQRRELEQVQNSIEAILEQCVG